MAKPVPQPIASKSSSAYPPYPAEYTGDMSGIEMQNTPIVSPSEKEFQLPLPYRSPGAMESNQEAPASPIANFTSTSPKPVTNTDIITSADAAQPIGYDSISSATNIPVPAGANRWNPNQLQSTAANKPTDYLSPEARKMTGYANAGLGGFTAGSQIAPTADSGDAMLQVGGATVGGAAQGAIAGAMVGGAPGALVGGAIGGLTALVTGGLNAWMGTSAARKQQRSQDKIRRDIQARDEARYQQARRDQEKYFNIERGDNMEKERYNRRITALQSQWAAQQKAKDALNETMLQDQNLKHMLVGELR